MGKSWDSFQISYRTLKRSGKSRLSAMFSALRVCKSGMIVPLAEGSPWMIDNFGMQFKLTEKENENTIVADVAGEHDAE